MKKYLKLFIVPLGTIILIPLFLSILNILKVETSNLIILIIMIISSFITGYLTGKISANKAYLKGLLVGTIISLLYFIISLLGSNNYTYCIIIYYSLIILASVIGSMIGIQKKGQ